MFSFHTQKKNDVGFRVLDDSTKDFLNTKRGELFDTLQKGERIDVLNALLEGGSTTLLLDDDDDNNFIMGGGNGQKSAKAREKARAKMAKAGGGSMLSAFLFLSLSLSLSLCVYYPKRIGLVVRSFCEDTDALFLSLSLSLSLSSTTTTTTESNEAAKSIQCKVCMQSFVSTLSHAELRKHAENKHPKLDAKQCFPFLE